MRRMAKEARKWVLAELNARYGMALPEDVSYVKASEMLSMFSNSVYEATDKEHAAAFLLAVYNKKDSPSFRWIQ